MKAPAGEAFRSLDEFLKMMEQQCGEYEIKKVFVDGSDVCLLYDFVTPKVTTFFCSWYQVKDEDKFDPNRLRPARICSRIVTWNGHEGAQREPLLISFVFLCALRGF